MWHEPEVRNGRVKSNKMKCKNCGVSVIDAPLQRVNPKGEIAIWYCDNCLKQKEPELYENNKEDETEVEKELKNMFYPKT